VSKFVAICHFAQARIYLTTPVAGSVYCSLQLKFVCDLSQRSENSAIGLLGSDYVSLYWWEPSVWTDYRNLYF